jgi:hypothetical protein
MKRDKRETDGTHATPEQFVSQYAPALLEYLQVTVGERESHIEDLASHASTFAEAFRVTVGYF